MTGLRIVVVILLVALVPLGIVMTMQGRTFPAVLVGLASLVLAAAVAYVNLLRPPQIRLRATPVAPRPAVTGGGYSNGVPLGSFDLIYGLIARNDGARPGILNTFSVDVDTVSYHPRKPAAFAVSFSGLEWEQVPVTSRGPVVDPLHPVHFPVLLAASGREKVWFRARLSGFSAPAELAKDLQDLRGFTVTYHYEAGSETKPKRYRGTADFEYVELKNSLRALWQGSQILKGPAVLDGREDLT